MSEARVFCKPTIELTPVSDLKVGDLVFLGDKCDRLEIVHDKYERDGVPTVCMYETEARRHGGGDEIDVSRAGSVYVLRPVPYASVPS